MVIPVSQEIALSPEIPVFPVLEAGATLGEGPIWVERDSALWFVDIKGHHVHRFDPATGACRRWDTPGQIGWIVPEASGIFAVGLQSGIHSFDPASGRFTLLHAPERHLPGNRLNDATVDAAGGIWFGSMDDAEPVDSGRVYRFHAGRCREVELPPVCITNGPALSPDGGSLYHVDALGKVIWRSTIDADGQMRDTAEFARIEDDAGYPDGTVLCTVPFPVANVTKITCGGSDLSTIYATTARKGLTKDELQDQPLAGHLFAFAAGAQGQRGYLAAIEP